jgi:hypothetical protein
VFRLSNQQKKVLMMQKRKKEAATRKRAGNIMAKINRTKGQMTIYKTTYQTFMHFLFVNFPFICNNFPASLAYYELYIS